MTKQKTGGKFYVRKLARGHREKKGWEPLVYILERFMHANFGQLKARCSRFLSLLICANERKRSSRRTALTGLRFVPSVTVFAQLKDRLDSDFLQSFVDICISLHQ